MRKLLLLLSTGWLVFSISCDNPTKSKHNPYEQHPIEWPSLAKSPWPMYHGNPMGNGLSFSPGPTKGQIKWSYTPGFTPGGTGLAIDSAGNVYTTLMNGNLISLTPDGRLNWNVKLTNYPPAFSKNGVCCPMILKTGQIVVIEKDSIFIVNSGGYIEKAVKLPNNFQDASFQIDKTGNFYTVLSDGSLLSIDRNLNTRWNIFAEEGSFGGYSTSHIPVFLPSGKMLVVPGTRNIYGISTQGDILWQQPCNEITQVIVDCLGNIYYHTASDSLIIARNSEGKLRWKLKYPVKMKYYSRPTIAPTGWIIFAASNLLWVSPDGENIKISEYLSLNYLNMNSELVCDLSGTVYSTVSGYGIYASSINEPSQWKIEQAINACIAPAVAIGILYFLDWNVGGKIYAVE